MQHSSLRGLADSTLRQGQNRDLHPVFPHPGSSPRPGPLVPSLLAETSQARDAQSGPPAPGGYFNRISEYSVAGASGGSPSLQCSLEKSMLA